MSKKKQIEEMASLINGCRSTNWCKTYACSTCRAERIYNAGYRKQSEWISVDGYERYSVNEYGIVKKKTMKQE